MKLYYTDALQAAYMVREFGVKFKNQYFECIEGAEWLCVDEISLLEQAEDYKHIQFRIHEDSLPIFEPQVGDITAVCSISRLVVDRNEEDAVANRIACLERFKDLTRQEVDELFDKRCEWFNSVNPDDVCGVIIQRNNKPFFMPEED